MNIFFLDRHHQTAAKYHCDKHVVKMILETAQILSTAHRVSHPEYAEIHDGWKLYKATHVNHPSSKWARSGRQEYVWTWLLLKSLCEEYTQRYDKTHKVESSGLLGKLFTLPESIIGLGMGSPMTNPPQCMPDQYKREDPVEAYRAYYCGEKSKIAKWKKEGPPWWFKT